jgi:nucleotide-binding universal stress UspA family protein
MTEPDERMRRELDKLVPLPSDADASWEDALRRAASTGGGSRASRLRPLRPLRVLAVAGIALLVGSVVGFGFGSSVTPSGNAAGAPVGLGFLPEQGWDVLQTGARATKERPVVAIASNGAFAPDDAARGARNSSGLPYSTLLDLSPDGIVIVARFWVGDTRPGTNLHPLAKGLPLSLRDAEPMNSYSVQVRPERPLGQYQLLAEANGHNVELQVYFGSPRPSRALIAAAQRQVDRLVVNPTKTRRPASVQARAFPLEPSSVRATAAQRVFDTTVVCGTSEYGGVDVVGHRGTGRAGGAWDRPAVVSVTNGSAASGGIDNPTLLDQTITWATAGRPQATATLVEYHVLRHLYLIRNWGTHAVNNPLCRPTKARAALSPSGLQGGPLGPFDERKVCSVRPRVVVRVRAVLARPAVLQSYRKFARTTVPVKEARFVVQTQSGKRLAYAEVFESGKARLFTAPSCFVR